MSNESSFSGPYVNAALLCEKVLIEPGNVPTFVRVVDRFMVPKFSGPIPPGVQIPQQTLQVSLVVIVKSGDLGAGNFNVTIRLQKPDQTYVPDFPSSVFFNGGDDNGGMIVMPVNIVTPEAGLHWFDIVFEGVGLIARVPMRVLYQPVVLQIQQPPPTEDH